MDPMFLSEMFLTLVHCNANLKIAIVIYIISRFYYCSFKYPVADSVLSGTGVGWRGGTVKYNGRVLACPSRLFLLYLLERCILVLFLIPSSLKQRNSEENYPTQCYRTTSHVESWCICLHMVVQPTWSNS